MATRTLVDVGVNVGVKDEILALLKQEPSLSAKDMAKRLDKSSRTIERHLKELREEGRIFRHGSDKVGHWKVVK